MSELTAEIVRELLDCDITTGELTWRERDVKWFNDSGYGGAQGNCNRINARCFGKLAACKSKTTGYYYIRIFGKNYHAHRIIWLWYYGSWPDNQIDHLDGNPGNNCIENLADKTSTENQMNRKASSINTSGYPGVSFYKQTNKWRAGIKINKKSYHIGYFNSAEEAYEAWAVKAREMGFSERHVLGGVK